MTIIITKDVKSERRIGRKRLLGGNDRFHFATKCSYKTFYVFSIYYAKKPEETQQQHHFPPPSSSSPQAEQAASEARLPLDSPEQPLPAKHHLKIMWSLSRSYYTLQGPPCRRAWQWCTPPRRPISTFGLFHPGERKSFGKFNVDASA